MLDLVAKSPLSGLLSLTQGSVALTEATPASIISIVPFKGRAAEAEAALQSAYGVGLPPLGGVSQAAQNRVLWFGDGQYLLIADRAEMPKITEIAAVTDQSDAWAVMHLEGRDAAAVLARLCPIDLRPEYFSKGQTARTEVAHMPAIVTPTVNGFEIMVMQSLVKTAVKSLHSAMKSVAVQKM